MKKVPAIQLFSEEFHTSSASAVHIAQEAIITVNKCQTSFMINSAAQRMFGYTAAEALGTNLSHLISPRFRESHKQRVCEFGASGETERSAGKNCCLYGRRAGEQEFQISVKILCGAPKNIYGSHRFCTALLYDPSAGHRLKQEIETLRHQFRRIFEMSPIAILITEGELALFANNACLRLFAATEFEHIKGKSVYDFFHLKSRPTLRGQITRALTGKLEACVLNERLLRRDGSLCSVEIAIVALYGATNMPHNTESIVQFVITDITEREKASDELLRSRQELRRLSGSLIDAREEERRRIARELHDELGQRLSALKMDLTSLGHELHGRASQKRQLDMLQMLDNTVAAVRRLAADLRPLMLDDLGLNAAIEWLARETARRMSLEITVRLDEAEPPLNHRVATTLYRMVQEALTNVGRHAQASTVQIDLRQLGTELILTVQDDGIGLPSVPARSETSFGLLGMRERAILLGGQMRIESPSNGGCLVTVNLPLRASDPLLPSLEEQP